MPVKVVIIGGGASGLIAALTAAKNGAKVTILEHKDRVGKKILMTGNGKCNLTNINDMHGKYYSNNLENVYHILHKFDAVKTIAFFEGIGLYTKEKKDGGIYPVSEQAASVLDVLRTECVHRQIEIITDCEVREIQAGPNGGNILADCKEEAGIWKKKISYQNLIIACGGKAAPVSGSDGSGYQLAEKLGHSVITPLPALVQLRCEGKYFKAVAGVRAEAKLSLYIHNVLSAEETGELQLTDYGISGIPVFQFSRMVSKALYEQKHCEVKVNFLTHMSEKEEIYFRGNIRKFSYKTIEELLCGIVHKKIAVMICREFSLSPGKRVEELSDNEISRCLDTLKSFKIQVKSANPFENAQVCSGGIPLTEIDENMQSKLCPHLFFAGEILDCDGICGGYNLQWAWATGALAGEHAAKQPQQEECK